MTKVYHVLDTSCPIRKNMAPTQAVSSLFRTVPEKDYCNFFNKKGILNGGKMIDFLKYKKEDVSVATGIPLKSIRYDQKIPTELQERLTEWATAINLVF